MSRSSTPAYQIRRTGITSNSSLSLATASASGTNSTSTSRAHTPLARTVVSLEEWESKAPLSDEQLQSVTVVKDKYGDRALPEKFNHAESSAQGASRPSTPRIRFPLATNGVHSPSPSRGSPRPNTFSPSPQSGSHLIIPDPPHPACINTPQQFLDHFTALTLSTEHEQDSLYRDHLAEIVGLREKCDTLIELLEGGDAEVKEMLKCLSYVEERSESLRGACEDLLEEQTHLLTHTSQLAHRLTFFTFLEQAQRMLNNPGNNLVLSPDFLPMVKRLDECLGYLGEHRDFKDAELYLIRYQQCMTRSMTLIKLHFVAVVKALGQEVHKRTSDKALSETATQALIYTKFISLSQPLQPLLAELEQRVSTNPNELSSLLSECHSAWMTTRQGIMSSRVNEEITRMNPASSDLVDLTRSGCSYLKQTCLDEFNLFKHFFLSGESQLYGFLEGLCDYLYDHLRPRILHEPSLQVLCGVCTVLQALMVQDVSLEEEDESAIFSPGSTPGSPYGYGGGGEDYFSPRPRLHRNASSHSQLRRQSSIGSGVGSIRTLQRQIRRPPRKPLGRLHIEVLLKMVLQDAQTRLVFRAQALLSADVEYYAPKEGDLDYPKKLGAGSKDGKLVPREMSVSLDVEDDDEPAFLALPPPDAQASWYPTLRVTLWILSCLYSYVDNAVFEDLAQEAVLSCRRSLSSASETLSSKKDKSIDGKLFLVRHLLILKEMTAGLALSTRERKREWKGIGDFLKTLMDNATSILGYGSINRTTTLPYNFQGYGERERESARNDIDHSLKISCEALINQITLSAIKPLKEYLDKCTVYLNTKNSNNKGDLSNQVFATKEKVSIAHDEFKVLSVKVLNDWIKELRIYLADEDTVRVLVPPAQNAIVDAYRQFHDLIRAEYDFSTAASILTPSAVLTLLQNVA